MRTQTHTDPHRPTETHTDTHRHTDRHRHTGTQTDTQTHFHFRRPSQRVEGAFSLSKAFAHFHTFSHRHTGTQTDTETDRHTDTQTHRHIFTFRYDLDVGSKYLLDLLVRNRAHTEILQYYFGQRETQPDRQT